VKLQKLEVGAREDTKQNERKKGPQGADGR